MAKKRRPSNRMDSSTRNKLSGKRLKECMEAKNMKLSEMADWICANRGMDSYSIQYISQMRNGRRAISADNAFMFAECLDVDPDYLLGIDGWVAESHDDFVALKEDYKKQRIRGKTSLKKMKMYDHYIRGCGYRVDTAFFDPHHAVQAYVIHHRGKVALIPANEMRKFKKAIDEQIRLRMDPLMEKYQTDMESLHPYGHGRETTGSPITDDETDHNGK